VNWWENKTVNVLCNVTLVTVRAAIVVLTGKGKGKGKGKAIPLQAWTDQ
jgi:hypothetical protein